MLQVSVSGSKCNATPPTFELTKHQFDAMFDRRKVGAVAGDNFFDHRTQ